MLPNILDMFLVDVRVANPIRSKIKSNGYGKYFNFAYFPSLVIFFNGILVWEIMANKAKCRIVFVAELAYAPGLGPGPARDGSSTLPEDIRS